MNYYQRRGNGSRLPNPFSTYSNRVFPRTVKDVLKWAAYLWERNAKYRSAIRKVVSYFLSDITVTQLDNQSDVDAAAVGAYKDLLTDRYELLSLVLQTGCELAAMGNVFVSAERIFSRELLCPTPGCSWQMRLKSLRKGRDYKWSGKSFTGKCPRCGKEVTWNIRDVKTEDSKGRRLRFVFRAVEDMRVQFNRLTGTFKYLYKIPEDIVSAIKAGDMVYLEDTPKVFIDAAVQGGQLIEFPEESFFAARTDTLSDMDQLYKGWGLPLFMPSFDSVVKIQHLDKFNEAVIMDYLVPTRIISPAPANLRAGVDDPNRMPISGAQWKGFMESALRNKVSNPTQWIISPVPVNEQQIGGNKDVIPSELLEYEAAQMLSDMGIPQEFRQTNFQVVAPTMGLRMFERLWIHFAKGLNNFVQWTSDCASRAHQYEDMHCTLDMTSFVEDDMNKQVLLGLMQGNMIARTPVLERLGVDFEDDIKLKVKEQKLERDAAIEQQKEIQGMEMTGSVLPPTASIGVGQAQMNIEQRLAQTQGMQQPDQPAMPAMPAGAPGAAGGMPFNMQQSESASIEQLFSQAQDMAQELYAAPSNVRRQQLTQLKATNPALHAMVKQMMGDMSQQTASDAVAQARQPQ